MGEAPSLDKDAPDEALLAETGRSSPTSVGRVRKREFYNKTPSHKQSANRSTTRARLGKGCGTSTKAPREELLLLPPNALGQHVGAPAGLGR